MLSSNMYNRVLGSIMLSFAFLISSLVSYPNSIGILTPHPAFGQNSSTAIDLTKLMLGDAIQALNGKDVNGALEHLKLIDQELGISGNSIPIQTSKLLVEDAIQSLQNGDTNTALAHVLVANQQLGSSITLGMSQGNTIGGHAVKISGPTNNKNIHLSAKPNPNTITSSPSQAITIPHISAIKANDTISSPAASSNDVTADPGNSTSGNNGDTSTSGNNGDTSTSGSGNQTSGQ